MAAVPDLTQHPAVRLLTGGAPLPAELREQVLAQLLQVRMVYLEALPVPGAVFVWAEGVAQLESHNEAFAPIGDPDGQFAREVSAFMAGGEAVRERDWSDGDPVSPRHYAMRLARVTSIVTLNSRCLLTLNDRTAERRADANLRRQMFSDALTGLPNRAGFTDEVEAALGDVKAGELAPYAVLIVDLARFSSINDSIGSLAGDELLITVARRLVSAVRAGDRLARIGGNMFGILVRLIDGPGDALHVAQRIGNALREPFRLSELEIGVDCAIGCALAEPGSDSEDLLRHAQFALKRAKASGKVEVYQPTAFNQARRRFSLETRLRRAIEGDQLRLAFQPLVDLASGGVIGFEALARWTDGARGEVHPTEFIPVAEESGLIVPLGRWALDAATRTLAGWDERAGATLPLSVSVNVSAIQLARDDVAGSVAAVLDASRLAGNRLALELTESAIVADPDRATRVMRALKAMGASLAMDDFGTGYSNLAYLQRLPIDILKIDRSFITGMLGDRDKVAIVRAILSLAEALGMTTTAEGVETLELSQTLAALGCAVGQGFYYSRPLDADAAFAFWRSASS